MNRCFIKNLRTFVVTFVGNINAQEPIMLQTYNMTSAEIPTMMAVEEGLVGEEQLRTAKEPDNLVTQSMSYIHKILFGNKELRFERSEDEDSWIESNGSYSIFHTGSSPLLPYSNPDMPRIVNRDDVFTRLNIDPTQNSSSPDGRGLAFNRAIYIAPRTTQCPMSAISRADYNSPRTPRSPISVSYRPRTSCCAANQSQLSPKPHPYAASQSALSWGDTAPLSPHAANSPHAALRNARSARGGAGARRLHVPQWPAPAPACLTPTAARVFHAAAAAAAVDADADSAV
jgi:hypothetical protein